MACSSCCRSFIFVLLTKRTFNIATILLLLTSFVSTLIATATPSWIIGTATDRSGHQHSYRGGLFEFHVDETEITFSALQQSVDLETHQSNVDFDGIKSKVHGGTAFMIFAVIALAWAMIATCIATYRKRKTLMYLTAHVVTAAGTFTVIGIFLYTQAMGFLTHYKLIRFGYSYGFAWTATTLDIIAGVLMVIHAHVFLNNGEDVPSMCSTV